MVATPVWSRVRVAAGHSERPRRTSSDQAWRPRPGLSRNRRLRSWLYPARNPVTFPGRRERSAGYGCHKITKETALASVFLILTRQPKVRPGPVTGGWADFPVDTAGNASGEDQGDWEHSGSVLQRSYLRLQLPGRQTELPHTARTTSIYSNL